MKFKDAQHQTNAIKLHSRRIANTAEMLAESWVKNGHEILYDGYIRDIKWHLESLEEALREEVKEDNC